MTKRDQRILVACIAVGAWLGLLLFGWTQHGTVHLLLLLGLVAVPWRRL